MTRQDLEPESRALISGGDVTPEGGQRLLSVAEMQRALQMLGSPVPGPPFNAASGRRQVFAEFSEIRQDRATGPTSIGGRGSARNLPADFEPGWAAVVSAHAGAGASLTTLAIAEAAAEVRMNVCVIETAEPSRSGLIAGTNAELGTHSEGAWRRGRRGERVSVFRRATDVTPWEWPRTMGRFDLTLVDLGLPDAATLDRLRDSVTPMILVCHPTVPGVRAAERMLVANPTATCVLVALGSRKWPGVVEASTGPYVRAMRAVGQLVALPRDRRLEVSGATSGSLPRAVVAAGGEILGVLSPRRMSGLPTTPADPQQAARRADSMEGTFL